uniref:Uncharacterized protein n=1 Tax=Romanomermis culicivorax TaxID=13658 RepID=A0A915KMP6_ROMCU
MPVNVNPSTMPKMTGDVRVIASYQQTEGTWGPPARFIAQGLPPGIPTDSPLEIVSQMELMNLLVTVFNDSSFKDSSSITDAMRAVWSTDLATNGTWILGPDVTQWALELITDGTIHATPVDKILLDSEPSSPAVDAICRAVEEAAVDTTCCAVEQASLNAPPTAVVAASPSMTTTGAQTLAAIAQQQPAAAKKPSPPVANAFRETLHTMNDDVSIIEASPFPTATAPWSLKIGVVR